MSPPSFVVRETGRYGKSLYAKRDFLKDERVLIFAGPRIDYATIYSVPITRLEIAPTEGVGRYLCHSCDPNCGIRNRTEVVARRPIKAGEEVTVDYGMFVSRFCDRWRRPSQRLCQCRSSRCRGHTMTFDELPDDVKVEYGAYVSVYLREDWKPTSDALCDAIQSLPKAAKS